MKIGLSITILLCTYASAARSLPISPVLVLKQGFDTASLARETDTPQHPLGLAMTAVTVDGETAETLHVSVADLVDHDVLRSPEFTVAPTTTDEAKTVLWARGDVHTPALMFEWDEKDGTRWIATFPVTARWQRVVLSPKDFRPWLVDAARARLGFHPTQAVRFRMGLDASNSHSAPGPHAYRVARIGIEAGAVVSPAHTSVASTTTAEGWTLLPGDNVAEVSSGELHLNQRKAEDTVHFAAASTPLSLGGAISWSVSFEVRFGALRPANTRIELESKGVDTASITSDSSAKAAAPSFNGRKKTSFPLDDRWHRVRFVFSPGSFVGEPFTSVIWDGKEIASGTGGNAPDTLRVLHDGQEVGQQTEVWVRSVSSAKDVLDTPDGGGRAIEPLTASLHYTTGKEGVPVVGLLSQSVGIWEITALIHNHTPKDVWLVPYCLLFSNGSTESLFHSDGWRAVHDERTTPPIPIGNSAGPSVDMQATYIAPTADPAPTILLHRDTTQEISVYAEDGGGWVYAVNTSRDGAIVHTSAGNQPVDRRPTFVIFLQVPSEAKPVNTALTNADRRLSWYSASMRLPYQKVMEAIKVLPAPPKADARWISVPVQ